MKACLGLSAVDAKHPKDVLAADAGLDDIDLDDVWIALHHVLTGSFDAANDPLYDAVLGGTPVNDGRGPLFLTPFQVRRVDVWLSEMGEGRLRAQFAAHQTGEDAYERLEDYFVELAHFYRRAADAGWGVIKYLY